MNNNILIYYPKKNSTPVDVQYKITKQGDLKTISCSILDKASLPKWLELQKFELTAMKFNNEYDLVFEHKKFDRNLDTVLFIDRVFEKIMDTRTNNN